MRKGERGLLKRRVYSGSCTTTSKVRKKTGSFSPAIRSGTVMGGGNRENHYQDKRLSISSKDTQSTIATSGSEQQTEGTHLTAL